MARLEGSMTAIVTPMRDGRVDVKALRELVESPEKRERYGALACRIAGSWLTAVGLLLVALALARGR